MKLQPLAVAVTAKAGCSSPQLLDASGTGIVEAHVLPRPAGLRPVVAFRGGKGVDVTALNDLRAIRLGAYEDPEVLANDVIVVGKSEARRVFPQILQRASLLASPLVAI